jgi:hypothetical protein
MAPTFTLRLANVPIKEFHGRALSFVPRARWLIESDDPSWTPLNSSEGNINDLAHSDWAQRWATEKVAEHSPYTVVRWIEDDEHHDRPAWTAELKRIRHDFRIVWSNGDTETLRAKNADDAEEIRDTIRHGHGFIELVNANNDADFVNLRHVFGITYQPTEVDL